MKDVRHWLNSLDLGQYAEAFESNDIDWDVLPELDHDALKDIGVASAGHRLRILKAVKSLKREREAPSAEVAPVEYAKDASAGPRSEAERRQLTVMFCDLVGSTALSTQMDPEDLRDVITSFQDKCREAIQRYGGFIARYMGDGTLMYFGYPQAHEDDVERAARAGLDVVAAMAALNAEVGTPHGVFLAVRVGIATGPVIVGDFIGEGAAEEAAVVGEAPNLAARLQGVAQPNQVVVGGATKRMLGERFEFEDLGTHELKGMAEPVQVWRVSGERDIDTRLAETRATSATPLVGRQEEMGLLARAWKGAREGRGQVVLIQGEAGVGKSRLIETLREQAKEQEHTWLGVRPSPYYTGSPLYPVIEQVRRGIDWEDKDSDEVKLDKLERAMGSQTEFSAEEQVPLFASLLSLPLPEERYPPLNLSPEAQRNATLNAISGWTLGLTEHRPVLMVWEDLHWGDPTTVELLGLMLEQVPTVPMLMVGTYRPEFVPPWPTRTHLTPITLSRLERPEVEAIATNLAGGKALPAPVLEHIVAKADGVPLYVEELTKAILASEIIKEDTQSYSLTGSLADMRIPETLQDALMARLDRIPMVRELAQLGAIIGREFTYEMLNQLTSQDESTMRDGLAHLVGGELLYQRGWGQRSRYIFKHALIRDAAYQSLLRRKRQQFHGQIVELLESQVPNVAEAQPELVAHHAFQSETWDKAFRYSVVAAEQSAKRFANCEALTQYDQALQAAQHLGTSTEVDRLSAVYKAKADLLFTMSDFKGSRAAGDELLTLARRMGDRRWEALAYANMGKASMWAHDFEPALADTRRAIEIAERIDAKDILAANHWVLGFVSAITARLDESQEELGKALHYSRAVGDFTNESLALGISAQIKNWEGDYTSAIQLHEQATHIAREQNLQAELMRGQWLFGLSLAGQGRYDDALMTFENVTALSDKLGDEIYLGRALNSIGWLYAECGAFESAVQFNQRSGEIAVRRSDPEMLANVELNQGEIALAQGSLGVAKAHFECVERLAHAPETTDWMRWRWTCRLFVNLAELALTQGEHDRAQALANAGLEIAESTNSRKYLVRAWRLLGDVALARGQYQEAEEWLMRALSLAETVGNPPQLWKTHEVLGRLYEQCHRFEDAKNEYQSASRVIDRVKETLKSQALRDGLATC